MKNGINRQYQKVWVSSICILLVFAALFILFDCKAITARAISVESVMLSNNEFKNDSVIVIIDNNGNGSNKIYNSLTSRGIGIESIEDLTVNNIHTESGESRQILQINLKEKSKDNILRTINLLNKMDCIIR